LTVHQNDGSYLAHTQGRKHQTNLARRAAREEKEGRQRDGMLPGLPNVQVRRNVIKIGNPGYKIQKIRDPVSRQTGLQFQLFYPEITPGIVPRHRFMSAWEQKVEEPDKGYQYLLIAAEPYNTISFKIQAKEIDRSPGRLWEWFNEDTKEHWIQLLFKTERDERYSNVPGLSRR
jgi:splicing factor 3A subunit 2